MKKLIIIPFILVMILGLTGCSSSISIGSIETETFHEMSASYTLFSGSKETELTVEDGEEIVVSADIVTKNGTIDAFIYKDDEEYNYEGHDIPTSSFTVTLSEPGDYTIQVDSNKHRGSYSFSWE